jgi:glycosyltransferase involved in cell wall biosynthesis
MTITSESGERSLRILVVHNAYQFRGGEDSVVEAEVALLRAHGHHVTLMQRDNDDIVGMSRLSLALNTLWSRDTGERLAVAVRDQPVDVIHVHNTMPLISPSVYWAADRLGIPVVQTLHNFRLLCPQATFLREGKVCEDCLGHMPWQALRHRCYRDSVAQTGAVVATLGLHRALGTYQNKVSRYIALNEFCKSKFVAGGLPADRIVVKPNFVSPPETVPGDAVRAGGLYVGRLSVEKGIDVLADALALKPAQQAVTVTVMGDGPLRADMAPRLGAAYVGPQPLDQVMRALQGAAYLVLPSTCYEGFPRTLVEAYASGVPVIASRHGSLQELVQEGQTGLLFEPGDAVDLARKLAWAEANPEAMRAMGRRALAVYQSLYTPEQNLALLTRIYHDAIAARQSATSHSGNSVETRT